VEGQRTLQSMRRPPARYLGSVRGGVSACRANTPAELAGVARKVCGRRLFPLSWYLCGGFHSEHVFAAGPIHVANAVIELVTSPDRSKGTVFIVSGKGLEVVPSR
jgi:hypothetical protein